MVVKIPAGLLLDRRLTYATKLVWMVLQLESMGTSLPSSGYIQRRCGLARSTAARAMRVLRENDLLNTIHAANAVCAKMPRGILLEKRLGVPAKILYGILQVVPGYQGPNGHFKYSEIYQLTGMCSRTVARALVSLQMLDWIEARQAHKYADVQFTLRNQDLENQEKQWAAVKRRLDEAPFRGEALMREYLTLIVDSDEYQDNATPGFLVNPYTSEKVEFDRYYPVGVAFEFNGPQHYKPTPHYPDEKAVRKQMTRDLVKVGICKEKGIVLRVVHPQDLSLKRMTEIVRGLLPLRDLEGHELIIKHLERDSRTYRQKAALGPFGGSVELVVNRATGPIEPKEGISAPRMAVTSRS